MKSIKLTILLFIFLLYGFLNSSTAQWVQVSNGMSNVIVISLAYSGNYIFAGTYPVNGVYLSTNNGTTWTQTSLNNQMVHSLAVNGNNIFAGSGGNNGVYKSTDNGTSWAQTSLNNRTVISFLVNGNNIFAGTQLYGIYISTNNGTSWTQTSLNNRSVNELAVSENNIFAGTGSNYGVYLSINNGTSWTQTSLNNRSVNALAVNGNNIFAGTDNNGIYVSNDNGTNWIQRNEGLPNAEVHHLCILNNYIFAGTNNSVYRRPLGELTGIQTISNEVPQQFSLSQNYPNPFNPATKIEFSISENAFVSLKIYDVLGKEVASLVNENLSVGNYNLDFNAANLTSGIFFYKLTAGNYSDIKKMTLLK